MGGLLGRGGDGGRGGELDGLPLGQLFDLLDPPVVLFDGLDGAVFPNPLELLIEELFVVHAKNRIVQQNRTQE